MLVFITGAIQWDTVDWTTRAVEAWCSEYGLSGKWPYFWKFYVNDMICASHISHQNEKRAVAASWAGSD